MEQNEHSLVKETRTRIKKEGSPSSYNHGLYNLLHGGTLPLTVSKELVERTLNFYNNFILRLEEKGFKITKDRGYCQLVMNNEEISFYVREQTKRVKKSNIKNSWELYDYIPCGTLVFKTKMYGTREFRDTSVKIEDKIDEIIEYYESKTLEEKNWKIKVGRNQRKKEIIRWFDLRKQKKVKEELLEIKDLFENSKKYKTSCEIRNYINEIERNKEEKYVNQKEWIEWSRNIVDWYDPTIEKEIQILSDVNRDSLTLYEELKSYVDGYRVDINEGDENEMLNELIEILDIESDEKEEK
jgi:hypothetical protein